MSQPNGYRGVEPVDVHPETMPVCTGLGMSIVPDSVTYDVVQTGRVPGIKGHDGPSMLTALMVGLAMPVQIGALSGLVTQNAGVLLRIHDVAQLAVMIGRIVEHLPTEQRAEYDRCHAEVLENINDMPVTAEYVPGHGPFDGDAAQRPASTDGDV